MAPDLVTDLLADLRARIQAFNASRPADQHLLESVTEAGTVAMWRQGTYPAGQIRVVEVGSHRIVLGFGSAASPEEKPSLAVITLSQLQSRSIDAFVVGPFRYASVHNAIEDYIGPFLRALAGSR